VLLLRDEWLLARTETGFKPLSGSPFASDALDAGARNGEALGNVRLGLSTFESVGDTLSKIE